MQRLEPYADEIHRFVARRVDNSADAADIAQQALLQACSKIDGCRGRDVAPWLRTIARHLIVDHYRTKRRFRFLDVTVLAETEPALRTSRDAVPSTCERRERLSCLQGCITGRLRLEQQVAVLLSDVHGYRDKESATVLRMSTPSFKLLLHGARTRLQEVAGGRCVLVRKSPAVCEEPVSHDGRRQAGSARTASRRQARLGVTCRLGARRLVALRARLMNELRMLGLVFLQALEDLAALGEEVSWFAL